MLLTSWLRSLPALMVRGSRRGLFRRVPQARALLGQRSHWGGAHVSAHAGGLRFNEGAEWLEERALLATITVTSLEDNTTSDGAVTLREAIQAAQTDSAVDGSTAGSGADTIEFAPALFTSGDASITLTLFDTGVDNGEVGPTALKITSNLTITGPSGDNGLTMARATNDTNKFRLFHVTTAGTLTLANLTLLMQATMPRPQVSPPINAAPASTEFSTRRSISERSRSQDRRTPLRPSRTPFPIRTPPRTPRSYSSSRPMRSTTRMSGTH